MKPGQCATGVSVDSLTPHDRAEVERFAIYLRQVGQAKAAGLSMHEAQRAIYPDTYADPDGHASDDAENARLR